MGPSRHRPLTRAEERQHREDLEAQGLDPATEADILITEEEAGDQAGLGPDDPEAATSEVLAQAAHEGHFTSLPGAVAREHVLRVCTLV